MREKVIITHYREYLRELVAGGEMSHGQMIGAMLMMVNQCATCIHHMEAHRLCGALHDRTKLDSRYKCEDHDDQPGNGVELEDVGEYLHSRMRRMYKR